MAQILTKITAKTVMQRELKIDSEPVWLYRVAGSANGYEIESSQYGESTRLLGEFQAINLETGEVFISQTCFLPQGMAELVAAKASKETPTAFMFDIGIKPSGRKESKKKPEDDYEFMIRTPDESHKQSAVYKMLENTPLPVNQKSLPKK